MMPCMIKLRTLLAAIGALVSTGCVTMPAPSATPPVALNNAAQEIPEVLLLDVGIEAFAPGELSEKDVEKRGLLPEIRDAEARFIPVHLRNTMQRTGHWGAVRVVPEPSSSVDVRIAGKILKSDGGELVLEIAASDATGREWFSRRYRAVVEARDYADNVRGTKDVFQSVYNGAANDLAAYKASLAPERIAEIRQVAELTFAQSVASSAFDGFVTHGADGITRVERLPATDDPMFGRVLQIRERELMLIDAVSSHYDRFYDEVWDAYENWRVYRVREIEAERSVERRALGQTLLGVAAIVGAIAIDVAGGGQGSYVARDLMLIGGVAAVKSGYDTHQEAAIHADAIRELGASFEAEATPLVVEVEGETVELRGSAETQYRQWRELLGKIYAVETGFPIGDGSTLGLPAE